MVPPPPDIVLVMTDQQRFDQVGWASGGHFETPNLDRLAARGIVFDQAYSAATTCIPARVSLLTGLASHRVPVEPGTDYNLAQGTPTVARTLRAAGYQTAMVGKMHFWPVNGDHGFDHLATCEHLFPGDFIDGHPVPDGTDDYHRDLIARGLVDWRSLPPPTRTPGGPRPPRFPYDASLHPTGWVADRALEVLARRDPDRPLFLVVSFPHPHEPHNPPDPWASAYTPADSRLPADGFEANAGLPAPFLEALDGGTGPWAPSRVTSPDKLAGYLALVRALVRQIDDAVGPVLDQLDLDRTLVMFTSDHGDYAGHRGLTRKLPWMAFDDLARVPLVVAAPDTPPDQRGRHRNDLVQSSDFALTALGYAGLAVDPRPYESEDLRPLLVDPAAATHPDRTLFITPGQGWAGVRWRNYKWLGRRALWFRSRALFDLDTDPGETTNLAEDPADTPVADELEHRFDVELDRPPLPAPAERAG